MFGKKKLRLFMKVNVLGTTYSIIIKKYDEDEAFERRSIAGYCDCYQKQIVICDMFTYKGWEHEFPPSVKISQNQTLRHEIVHAFFAESGLEDNCLPYDDSWPNNEELVDWIAIQGPKIYRAWQEAGAL